MERKLASVLFVDIVDSTRMVTGADPEVVRRRVTRFFDTVSSCVEQHGGLVEKFAGDAVMAAFGVPQAHEDDAQRAVAAALAIREGVEELGLEARIGIEAGEVVVDATESTFATGEAVNLAARLQEAARPGEILVGPTAYRLAAGTLVAEDAGPLELKGIAGPLRAWRVVEIRSGPGRPLDRRARLVGRDAELDLLENTFNRSLRDRRAHLFTIYGEAGVGKSRLAREFLDGVERASVLIGRALPYGEGVTYWPLGEMVKAAAGISDDDPLEEAFEKLRECCAEDAVADVLGLAAGLMEALEGERSPQEISWAAREVMQGIAEVQPLILLFEDIHWAEAPLLDLIEHIADWVRAPVLILCLARPELLDARAGWGGGRVRSTAIELEPLSEEDSAELVEQLLSQLAGAAGERPAALPQEAIDRAEGNPLFVEETIRMLLESGVGNGSADRVPDTLQALIAARIDHLDPAAKTVLQRSAVVGRVFWRGAIEHLAPDVDEHATLLEDLLQREFLLREPRSSISGETAYRFKHALIREVAYTGMAKLARAQYHARFAEWLAERTGEELVEIRAYHLDRSVEYLTELEGAPPEDLAHETAAALVKAAKRAIAREAYVNARTLGLRALELRPTLGARYVAARAAWRLQDFAAVQVEMEKVREQAIELDEPVIEALALTALSEAALKRDGEVEGAQVLVDRALEILARQDDPVARFDALTTRAIVGGWHGHMDEVVLYMERAYALAMDAGRKDLQTFAAQILAQTHIIGLELDEAELLLTRALELAGESGSIRARAHASLTYGWFLAVKGELDAAETVYEEVRQAATELGIEPTIAVALMRLGAVAAKRKDYKRAEKLLREAVRMTESRGDLGVLSDVQSALAHALAAQGKVEEAERLALAVQRNPRSDDPHFGVTVNATLAAVRAAQGRDEEAERLYRDALAGVGAGFPALELEILEEQLAYYRDRGRPDEASACEARIAELLPSAPARAERIA